MFISHLALNFSLHYENTHLTFIWISEVVTLVTENKRRHINERLTYKKHGNYCTSLANRKKQSCTEKDVVLDFIPRFLGLIYSQIHLETHKETSCRCWNLFEWNSWKEGVSNGETSTHLRPFPQIFVAALASFWFVSSKQKLARALTDAPKTNYGGTSWRHVANQLRWRYNNFDPSLSYPMHRLW